jgi:hypothetical protein
MGRARYRAGEIIAYHVTNGVRDLSRPVRPYPALPRHRGVGDTTKTSSLACVDDNQPPAPKYLDDGDNYPIVPIDDQAHAHDGDTTADAAIRAEAPLFGTSLTAESPAWVANRTAWSDRGESGFDPTASPPLPPGANGRPGNNETFA